MSLFIAASAPVLHASDNIVIIAGTRDEHQERAIGDDLMTSTDTMDKHQEIC
jgi:hypothetical protein